MIDTLTNGITKLRLLCTMDIAFYVCEESRWVDYMLALNILLGNSNAATRLKTINNDFFNIYILYMCKQSLVGCMYILYRMNCQH